MHVEAIQPIMPAPHQHPTNLSTADQNKKMQNVFLWFYFILNKVFFVFFPPEEGPWTWLKTHNINHPTPLDETPTNSTPYTSTQSPINAQTT